MIVVFTSPCARCGSESYSRELDGDLVCLLCARPRTPAPKPLRLVQDNYVLGHRRAKYETGPRRVLREVPS